MRFLESFFLLLSGFRKFVIMVLLIIISIIFRVTDFISGAEWVDLLKNTVIAFMSFNGIEHMTDAVKDWAVTKMNSDKEEDKKEREDGSVD